MQDTTEIPEPLTARVRFLTPSDNADKYHTYRTALIKGISDPDVTNIAISGPYGSGKSSIIKTFIKNQENKNEYLQISLANFEPKGGDIGQMIEKSILQQMFYKVESSKVPYSKLKRIVAPESMTITKSILFIMTFSALMYLLLNPKDLVGIFDQTWMLYATVFLFLTMAFYGLYRTAAALKNVKLSKVVIKDAEFNLAGEGENVSLINRHLDEIIYFFEATEYKTLIIEDLDRFDNVAIFEKLRELNTLVNNYDRIKTLKGKITFIYAIKDNFFIGENRSKFFDLIVPVVPYINAAGNARDPLVRELREAGISEGTISTPLLKNVSKFIHDHRLLVNIVNEYLVYLNEFNPGLKEANRIDLEKLFCMIVYKNFYPADFADLHQSKGWLYDLFNKKKIRMQNRLIIQIHEKLESLKTSLAGAEKEMLDNEIDLRAAYVFKVMRDSNINPKTIQIDNTATVLKDIIDNPAKFKIFLESTKILYHNFSSSYANEASLIHNVALYEERLKNIQNKAAMSHTELNDEYSSLQAKRSIILGMSMAAMLKENHPEDPFTDIDQLYKDSGYSEEELAHKLKSPNILKYFIRGGKISEDYATYISYFHEGGALSRSDNDFIMKVIEGQKIDPSYTIDSPKLVIGDLEKSKFLDPAILNFAIVNEVFSSVSIYSDYAACIFKVLNDRAIAREFIPEFLNDFGLGREPFVRYFAEHDKGFWDSLESFEFDRDKMLVLLGYILQNCKKDTILSQGDWIVNFIYGAGDYLFSSLNKKQSLMLKTLLLEIGQKFIRIDKPVGEIGENLFSECVYEFNMYVLNPYMIALILKVIGGESYAEDMPDEHVAEYSNIVGSTLTKLKKYVEENIDVYVRNVYLLTLGNEAYSESYDSVCKLLNHEALDARLKYAIVEKMQTVIKDIEDVDFDSEVYSALFAHFKIDPTWENVYAYIREMVSPVPGDQTLMKFLSNEDIAKQIATTDKNIPDDIDEATIDKAIIFNSRTEVSILQIYRSCIEPFEDISDITDVTGAKIANAITAGYVSVTSVNYQFLQETQPDLCIKLIERDFKEAMEFIFDLEFNENDAIRILTSDKINIVDRYQYLSRLDLSLLPESHRMTEPIAIVINALKDSPIVVYVQDIFEITCKSSLSIDSKIELFLKYVDQMTNEAVYQFLENLGGYYTDLIPSEAGKSRFHFSKNKFNKKLFEVLHHKDLVGKFDIEDDEIIVNKKRKMR